MKRNLIIHADDFGASRGINAGILACHRDGVVTSTSLLVAGRAVAEAVALSRDCPGLDVGLHWDVWGEGEEGGFDLGNRQAVRDELHRQLDSFDRLLGRMPTHLDSHRHAHLRGEGPAVFRELAAALGVPLRYDGQVHILSSFYAQWEWQVTDLGHVSVPFLQQLLREEVSAGWTELLCHPGWVSPDFASVYLMEREEELRTLRDPLIRATIAELNITLASYADFRAAGQGRTLVPEGV